MTDQFEAPEGAGPVAGPPPGVKPIFVEIGDMLKQLSRERMAGSDPSEKLEDVLDWARMIVLGQLHKGVSLFDAALIVDAEGQDPDPESAAKLKRSWQTEVRAIYEHLPENLGFAPEHSQVILYQPLAIVQILEGVYGRAFCRQIRLKQELQSLARYPRPKTNPKKLL